MRFGVMWTAVVAVSLGGCSSTIVLNQAPTSGPAEVIVVDNREPAERVNYRETIMSPMLFFGDEAFNSPPLANFAAVLSTKLPAGKYELNVAKFRMVDVFPVRMGQGIAGGLQRVYIPRDGLKDNVTCMITGSLQSKPFDHSANVPYTYSIMTAVIHNDPGFRSAVNACLNQLAAAVAGA